MKETIGKNEKGGRSLALPIADVFESFEGEGLDIGVPKWFVRVATCPLKCKSCDTAYAFTPTEYLTVEQILARIPIALHNVVTITGGEPLVVNPKAEMLRLCKELKELSYYIVFETSGQFYRESVYELCDLLSVDAKSPSTGIACDYRAHEKLMKNFKEKTQIKIIVEDDKDLDFAIKYRDKFQPQVCIITPCWKTRETLEDYRRRVQSLYTRMLRENFIVITQQHKVFFDPGVRAV